MITYWTCSGATPERESAARIATSPSFVAGKSFSAPSSLPIGVRAPSTMTELMGYPRRVLNGGSVQTSPMTSGLRVLRVDHVGVAVADLDAAIAFHERVFGLRCEHRET